MKPKNPPCLALASVIALTLGLAGCETSDLVEKVQETVHDFNPFGTAKKRLPGDLKPVFPEGVPGVQQGVSPDLLVGAQPAADASPSPEAKPTIAAAKPKTSTRRKPKAAAAQREARPVDTVSEPVEQPPARTRRRATTTSAPQADNVRPEPAAQPAPAQPAARPAQA